MKEKREEKKTAMSMVLAGGRLLLAQTRKRTCELLTARENTTTLDLSV
jgi:hypothetical protein